jgi:prevent-host-death family protein
MRVTASKLRADIYNILDESLKTGEPVEVVRKGKILKIVPESKPSKLSRLKKRNAIVGDPEDLVHMDWLHEWSEMK